MALVPAILRRRSVREYSNKAVSDALVLQVLQAAEFAPSAHDAHVARYLVVRDAAVKNRLFTVTQQEAVRDAPVVLVFAFDSRKSGYALQDLSVASENAFLQAAALGLGTVWINLVPADGEKVKALLGVPKHFAVINLIPLGFPEKKVPPHVESDFDARKIRLEKW